MTGEVDLALTHFTFDFDFLKRKDKPKITLLL